MPAVTCMKLHIATEVDGNMRTIFCSIYDIMCHICDHLPCNHKLLSLNVYVSLQTMAFIEWVMTITEWAVMDQRLHVHNSIHCIDITLSNQYQNYQYNNNFRVLPTLTEALQDRLPLSSSEHVSC